MRGLSKKMLISILTSVVVFVTMIATTFAWVGIFTYANTDSFSMNLKVNKSSNYYLTISGLDSTDNNNYGEEIPLIEIQKQVLKNFGVQVDDSYSKETINTLYNQKTEIEPSTPIYDSNNNISSFERIVNLSRGPIDFVESKFIIKFDIYLSINTLEGIDEETTGINSSAVLDEINNTLNGINNTYYLNVGNPIRNNRYAPSGFDWQLYPAHSSLTNVTEKDGVIQYIDKREIQVNSSSAARFALEVYNPIKLTDTYTGDETPINTIVYQGGSALPTYNEATDVYSMGGILPEEYNFGVQEANAIYNKSLKIPQKTLDYESKVRTLNGTKKDNYVWKAPDFEDIDTENINYLGVMNGIQTKQKISVYFWFEGWDSDCTWVIDMKRVTMNLTLTADVDN